MSLTATIDDATSGVNESKDNKLLSFGVAIIWIIWTT